MKVKRILELRNFGIEGALCPVETNFPISLPNLKIQNLLRLNA
jgi:hypothetical protein